MKNLKRAAVGSAAAILGAICFSANAAFRIRTEREIATPGFPNTHSAILYDTSRPLAAMESLNGLANRAECGAPTCGEAPAESDSLEQDGKAPPAPAISATGAAVEQNSPGDGPTLVLGDAFDGLGEGFEGPQSESGPPPAFRNPSDNSLAVGPDEIVQTENSQLAVLARKAASTANPVRCFMARRRPTRFFPALAVFAKHATTAMP
jgi:hypothetical protein